MDSIIQNLPVICSALIVAILFIQSGLDKIIDWKGNLDWLKGHFAKSPLKNMVPMMLGTITVLEVAAGFTCLAGFGMLLYSGSGILAFYGSALAAVAIIALFAGQRIAKDYVGAATLVPYFILVLALMILSNPFA